jgi:hypothetical protein
VEGPTKTIFDGPVTTDGKMVSTAAGGGPHPCDGTPSGDGLPPGPTATSALDDGGRLAGFTWDGTRGGSGFPDFFITRIADETADPNTEFWSLYIDRKSAQLGGCQQRVRAGEEVLWARISFTGPPVIPLELSGPTAAITGQPFGVKVVDGDSDTPVPGATVGGATTGSDGIASLSFPNEGIYRLKAERPGAVRSNSLSVCVDPGGAQPCSSSDGSAPALQLQTPAGAGGGLASSRGRSRMMLITWAGDDGSGSGIAHYSLEARQVADGAGANQAGDWRKIVDKLAINGAHFRGGAGDAYAFRITATDRALNETTVITDPVVVPVDDRNQRLVKFSKRNWKRVRARSAWGGTVVRASRAGATARLRFRGTSLALVGRKLPKGGRLRATIDGRRTTIRLRGSTRHRSVVWTSRRLEPGAHRLVLRTLGDGPVELDAVAPLP